MLPAVPSPDQTKWEGPSENGGHYKMDWIFAHKNWYFKATILYSSLEKDTYKPRQHLLARSHAARTIAWKICLLE